MKLAGLTAGLALFLGMGGAAQYGRSLPSEWETDQFSVHRLVVPRGGSAEQSEAPDSIFVTLTAGLDGRMPPAEAVWEPAGPRIVENRGAARFEAIVIELKDALASPPATAPESIESSDLVDVVRLIDNPRVQVVRLKYQQSTYSDPPHFHPNDTLAVYLTAGYIWRPGSSSSAAAYFWPGIAWSSPAFRVQRGDVDVVPANTLHAFSNAGGDPLEFLAVILK